MSDIELPQRYRTDRLVNPARGEISDTELYPRFNHVRLVNPATDEISDTELPSRSSPVRLIANPSPVKSLTLASSASRSVKISISATVIMAPDALPRAASTTARRLGSGMFTVCAVVANGIETQINRKKVRRKSCVLMGLSPLRLEMRVKCLWVDCLLLLSRRGSRFH